MDLDVQIRDLDVKTMELDVQIRAPTLPERIHRLSTAPSMRVISLGGATEAAIWSNMFEIPRGWKPSEAGWSCIPYGRPLRNQTMYILDDATIRGIAKYIEQFRD